MKIAVTGTSSGFGKYILDNWDGSFGVSLRDPLTEIVPIILPADIFINLAYSRDTKQSSLFYEVYEEWKNTPKTIINIGTSAITENETFDPLYVSNKKHLINLASSITASSNHKLARVINFNPSTLENNKLVPEGVSKLKFESLLNILKFIVNLPQEVEISDLIIRSTQKVKKSLL